MPTAGVNVFQVRQTVVPTIEQDHFRGKVALEYHGQHRLEMVIFAQSIDMLIHSIVTRNMALPFTPQQWQEIDSFHRAMMFA